MVRVLLVVGISLALHFAASFSRIDWATSNSTPSQPVDVELLDKLDERQFVDTSKARSQKKDDKKADFIASETNRPDQETRSETKGRFQHGGTFGGGKIETTPDGDEHLFALKEYTQESATPDHIDEKIPLGAETVLRADGVVYGSFLNRVKDAIYDPWVREARNVVEELNKLKAHTVLPRLYVTKLQVELDIDGRIRTIRIAKSSGITELDDAPKTAFWEQEPFLNPPKQLFRESDIFVLNYEFQFELKSSQFRIAPLRI